MEYVYKAKDMKNTLGKEYVLWVDWNIFILKMSFLRFIYEFDAVPDKISKDTFVKPFKLIDYHQAKNNQDTPVK